MNTSDILLVDDRMAGGYGRLKGNTLRIAHMADTTLEDIERLLQALDEFLSNR